jgi:RNA polymerase sigma factor (sigma-70 family)
MPATPLRSVLQAAFSGARREAAPRTDAELLAAFAAARDEAAFAELVRRHGRLVRGTARRIVSDPDTAEDVFQAAFLLLSQKAAAISWRPTVGPWLYQTTVRLAAKARARAARRRFVPIAPDVPAPAADPAAGLAWAEVRDALDRALAVLPARLRDPLVLCCLEGLTRDEAAAALGCSATAIKGRVARGRERLRRLLARCGLSLPAALGGALVADVAGAANGAAATARAALAFPTSGAAPPAVRELLRGTWLGWKSATALVGIVFTCAAAALGLAGGGPAANPALPSAKAPAAVPQTATGEAIKKLTGHVRWVTALVFTPDGRRLVSGSADQTGLVWDATLSALGDAGGGKPAGIGPAEAWDRLAAREARVGYAAMAALVATPAEAVALLRTRLRPAPVPTAADLDRLFQQLDSEKYDERQKASAELETFGPNAVAGVKARLERAPPLELRKRLERFLEGYGGPSPSPYLLRSVRGVAVLEAVGAPEARALLAELAKGPANDPLTREARTANRRRTAP